MSEFSEFCDAGADVAFAAIGTTNVTRGTVTRGAIITPVMTSKPLRDAGVWSEAETVAEIKRSDFTALALVEGSEVAVEGKRFRVVRIEDDPHDSCVRAGLKLVH
jgi:hypothetical protein